MQGDGGASSGDDPEPLGAEAVADSIAELNSAGLAHLPSGKFLAKAAWLAFAVIAHNLARAVGALGGTPRTRSRRCTGGCSTPARLVHTARRLHLRLPARWPWASQFATAPTTIAALPNPG